jgi:hypothetical protein
MEKVYTEDQVKIKLIEQKNDHIYMQFGYIHKVLDKLESNQRWLLGLMGLGFASLMGLMAHGFKWIL